MIDTHCHLTYDGLHERIDQVIAAAAQAGVDRMITVGTTPADAEKARALSHRKPNIYFAAGLHPHYAESYTDKSALLDALREKLADEKCVALGEMGLDRHYPDPPIDLQRRVFEWQLELASEKGDKYIFKNADKSGVAGVESASPRNESQQNESMGHRSGEDSEGNSGGTEKRDKYIFSGSDTFRGPIIIHNREATGETLSILSASAISPERFVFHCFTGSANELDAILTFGAMVSLTGIVTFPSAKDLAQATDAIPLNRLMIETDSPYLTPAPHRKVRPNEPRYVADVARFLADRRGLSLDDFVAAVDANAQRFFGLD